MTDTTTSRQPGPGCYEIRTRGHLDARWGAWFDGLVLARAADGTTVIHGPDIDQAALYAVLLKLRDLGLPLLSVTQVTVRSHRSARDPVTDPR
jgi:hypothetical protein